MSELFSYSEAFSRNLGLISLDEQRRLKESLIVIAGCGGVGSAHAHTLARLGFSRFRLADPDEYGVGNFNRQIAATMNTLGRNKAEATADLIRSINPEAEIEVYQNGINGENIASFVVDADLVVDGIDFFCFGIRQMLFSEARRQMTSAMTAAPLGFSGAFLHFDPQGMSFDEYFNIRQGDSYYQSMVSFILGLSPGALHLPYMDISGVDPETGVGPSSSVGVQMASCLLGAQAVKHLLGRPGIYCAPHYVQFDAYRLKSVSGRLYFGNRHPLQRLKRVLLKSKLRELGLDKLFSR